MNPKKNTRGKFFGENKQSKDKFRGQKGKVRKKQLHQSKAKNWEVIDSEIERLKSRYETVSSNLFCFV